MDSLPPEARSRLMASIKSKDTKPELVVRKLVHSLGYRFRLHATELPGKPDLVFRKKSKIIFVHGCFWHCHTGCKNHRIPKSRVFFWKEKLFANKKRDRSNIKALLALGFYVKIVWECQTKDLSKLAFELKSFLS